MRDDTLADYLVRQKLDPIRIPARDMLDLGHAPFEGGTVAGDWGPLLHYTTEALLPDIVEAGQIGNPGCWLTPTAYASCMTPYDLGLPGPRDLCLVVDPSVLPNLWGPGTSPPSPTHPASWRGGGVEFFSPDPVPLDAVERIIYLAPCGDTHA